MSTILPNILFVTLDQWRADALSVGHEHPALTPKLAAFSREATHFTRHFGQAAPCGPARASLLTGLYAQQHGIFINNAVLDARIPTLFDELRHAGYSPTLFGYTDIVNVDHPQRAPSRMHGLDVDTLLDERAQPWLSHLREEGYASATHATHRQTILTANRFGDPAMFDAEHSDSAYLTDRFLAWLENRQRQENGKAPYCAHLSYFAPHPPFVAPAPFHTMFEGKKADASDAFARSQIHDSVANQHPYARALIESIQIARFAHGLQGTAAAQTSATIRQIKAIYTGQVHHVDQQLGRIFDALRQRDDWHNTLVIVTADHGEQLFDQGLLGKAAYFDPSVHVPLLIRVPRAHAAESDYGRRVDALTESIDLMPTVLAAIGKRPPLGCQGADLTPWCHGVTPATWRDAVYWQIDFQHHEQGRVRKTLGLSAEQSRFDVVRTGAMKYVYFSGLPPVLINLDNDPLETTNLLSDAGGERGLLVTTLLEDAQQRHAQWRKRCEAAP